MARVKIVGQGLETHIFVDDVEIHGIMHFEVEQYPLGVAFLRLKIAATAMDQDFSTCIVEVTPEELPNHDTLGTQYKKH